MEFFQTHMGKIPVREKKLIKSLWGFSLSLGCFHCLDKPFSHFLPTQSKQYPGNFQTKLSWNNCYGKEKTKNLLIQRCWRLHTDVTNTFKAVFCHCSKHFLPSDKTKQHCGLWRKLLGGDLPVWPWLHTPGQPPADRNNSWDTRGEDFFKPFKPERQQVAHGWWYISPRSWKHPCFKFIFNFWWIWSFNIK